MGSLLCSLLAWCPEPGLVPDWGGLALGRPELPASHLPKGAWPHPVGLGRYILGVMEKVVLPLGLSEGPGLLLQPPVS